jgi:hypothetical protein
MTMKQGAELEAGGVVVSIDLTYKDKALSRVEIVTEDGAFAIVAGQYSGIGILVPQVVSKFAVVGELEGLDIYELFEFRHEADARHDVLFKAHATIEVREVEITG